MKVKGLILGGALLMSAGVAQAGKPANWLLEGVSTAGPGHTVKLVALSVYSQAGQCKQAAKAINGSDFAAVCEGDTDPYNDGPCNYAAATCMKIFEVGSPN